MIKSPNKNIHVNKMDTLKKKKIFNILNWVFIGVTSFIFCILVIIASIFLYLIVTDKIGRLENPLVYALYVTAITFVIMDLCLMLVWLVLIHMGIIINHKYNLVQKKRLFSILNISFLVGFFLLNVGVVVLLVLWLGGFTDKRDVKIMYITGICIIEVIKALIMIATLVVSIIVLKQKRTRKIKNNY